jgi:pSer/pThr/pTyr-binding forkhead associated (FHA) protein
MASLCLLDENGAMAERWELDDNPVAVGRGAAADIIVPDPALSRRHFLIFREGDKFLLKDLGSQNGTWVDGQRAQTTNLRHHDCILAGRTVFLFKTQMEAAHSALELRNA